MLCPTDRRRTVICLLFVLASGLALAETSSEESPQVSPFVHATRGKSGKPSTPVYGNDELREMFGAAPAKIIRSDKPAAESGSTSESDSESESSDAAEAPVDALTAMFAAEAKRKEQALLVAQGEAEVATARQSLVDLEKRLLAVRNPYLARPKTLEADPEAWSAADSQQRVNLTNQQLEKARTAISDAEQALAKLRSSGP